MAPPSYPTAASTTPGISRKADSTPQKHPAPKVAFSNDIASPKGFDAIRAIWLREVYDALAAARTARRVKTRIISRRYSGVNIDVVSGLATWAAISPTTCAW